MRPAAASFDLSLAGSKVGLNCVLQGSLRFERPLAEGKRMAKFLSKRCALVGGGKAPHIEGHERSICMLIQC